VTGLKYTMAAIPGGNTRRAYGTAFWDGTAWFANVGGNLLTCRWADPFIPLQGGNIVVEITTDERGQSSAFVAGGYSDQPRPSTGTILTMTPDVVVAGAFGGSVIAARLIGTYTIGDSVQLIWDSAQPTVIGTVPSVALPPPANVPKKPGGGDITGTLRTPATRSDTWGNGGWGKWFTSLRGGEDVYSGTDAGQSLTGSWFYGLGNTMLADRILKEVRFRLPQRLGVGASGPATIHLYAHTSPNKPGGDVSRTVGPFDVTVAQNAPAQWVTLPTNFHAALVAGGGISISGDPYAAFAGRLKDPESGKLEIDWTT
jgi:hypothetical protein